MGFTVSWSTVVTAAAVVGALVALAAYAAKLVRWVDQQKNQDAEIAAIKKEQAILTFGVLACLKGLKEQGCNGPVTDAIDKIEKFLNTHAHE